MKFFRKVHSGLSKSRDKISRGFKGVLGKGKLTEDTLEDLEEELIGADIAYEITASIIEKVRERCLGSLLSNEDRASGELITKLVACA